MLILGGGRREPKNQLNQNHVVDSGIWTQATLAEGVLLALRQPCFSPPFSILRKYHLHPREPYRETTNSDDFNIIVGVGFFLLVLVEKKIGIIVVQD